MSLDSSARNAFVPAGSGNDILALALFLKILVFFLLLNSISFHSSERSEKVLESLKLSVGFDGGRGTGTIIAPNAQEQLGQGASLEEMGQAFVAELPGVKPVYIRHSGVLTLTLPANQFNARMGFSGAAPDSQLQKIWTAVKPAPGQPSRYDVVFQVNIRPDLYRRMQGEMSAPSYIAMWAAALMRAGLDPAQIAMGLGPGPAGSLTLTFTPRNKGDSK